MQTPDSLAGPLPTFHIPSSIRLAIIDQPLDPYVQLSDSIRLGFDAPVESGLWGSVILSTVLSVSHILQPGYKYGALRDQLTQDNATKRLMLVKTLYTAVASRCCGSFP